MLVVTLTHAPSSLLHVFVTPPLLGGPCTRIRTLGGLSPINNFEIKTIYEELNSGILIRAYTRKLKANLHIYLIQDAG
uniref:Uncharacterized protein n=1 Tax=Knipowitschia caucasica TaxID=637954 RepID=A0AAV2LSI7_KNICA